MSIKYFKNGRTHTIVKNMTTNTLSIDKKNHQLVLFNGINVVSRIPIVGEVQMTTDTLFSSNWNNQMYDLSTIYNTDEYYIMIDIASTATKEQATAFFEANLTHITMNNVVRAYGTVPTIDIPITVATIRK